MGQKGVKFDLWPLAICKPKFLEIRHIASLSLLIGFKNMLNIKKFWGSVFEIFWKILIFGPKMAHFGPQLEFQYFLQDFDFFTFFTFGILTFLQNFRKKPRSGCWDYWVTGQKWAKFDLWPLATSKPEFSEIWHIVKFEPTN